MSDFKPDIWKLQTQFNTQGLVEALGSDDAGIRRRAAAALRALGAINAIPEIEHVLEREEDPETRSHLSTALEALKQEKERREKGIRDTFETSAVVNEVDRLIEQLKSNDPEQIIETSMALGNLGDKLAVPALMVLFTDPGISIRVRLAVAEALLKLESAPVEVTLLGALRSDDWRVRRNGAAILGQLRANWAIEPLAQALFDENEHVRKTAFAALRHIGTPDARSALQQAREEIQRRRKTGTLHAVDANDASGDGEEESGTRVADDTRKIVWPNSRRKKPVNPTLAPTKPLDPATLDRVKHILEKPAQSKAEMPDTAEDDSPQDQEEND